ncbi:MAG: BF3164 family lipoprotein [Bacteroidales bacterium]
MVLIFLVGACQPKEESSGPVQLSIQGKEFQVDEPMTPGTMTIFKDHLVKRMDREEDSVFRIFDLRDDSYCFQALRKGRGPGEIANPAYAALDEKDGMFWLADWSKNCVVRISLDSLLTDPSYKPSYSFPFDETWIPVKNMFVHPSGNIGFTSDMLSKQLISYIDTAGNLVDSLAIPTSVLQHLYDEIGISEVPLWCLYVPERDKIVVASHWENKFWILDLDGRLLLEKDNIPERTTEVYSGNGESSFWGACADEKYIYFIYLGGTMINFGEDGDYQTSYPNRILVVDWEGNFRYDIALDHRIIFFALDKKRKRLICDSEEVDQILLSYDLSWLYEE